MNALTCATSISRLVLRNTGPSRPTDDPINSLDVSGEGSLPITPARSHQPHCERIDAGMQIASPNWLEERDRLLADTQDFIRQVANDHPPLTIKTQAPVTAQPHVAAVAAREQTELPPPPCAHAGSESICSVAAKPEGEPAFARPVVGKPAIAKPVAGRRTAFEIKDLRQELNTRIAAFRDRQQALQAERDADYEEAIQRIRTVTIGWRPRLSAPPPVIDEPRAAAIVSDGVDEGWNRIWLSIVQVADGEPQTAEQHDR
jgi:hypothetical protein